VIFSALRDAAKESLNVAAKEAFSGLGHVNLGREIGLAHFYGKVKVGWAFFARRPIRMLPFFLIFFSSQKNIYFSQWNEISDVF
jgi:hypothetical protein